MVNVTALFFATSLVLAMTLDVPGVALAGAALVGAGFVVVGRVSGLVALSSVPRPRKNRPMAARPSAPMPPLNTPARKLRRACFFLCAMVCFLMFSREAGGF